MSSTSGRRAASAIVVATSLVLAACGGESPNDPAAEDATSDSAAETGAGADASTTDTASADNTNSATANTDTADPAAEDEGLEVRFTTPDGVELAGTVFGEGTTGVVLAHMRGRDRGGWIGFARDAAAAGHQVLAFDFRGYGASTGTRDTELVADISAAVDFMRARGVERTVVIGASMGGTAAVIYASTADIAGAVAISAPGNFVGLDAAGAAVDVGEPLLLIAGEGDTPFVDDIRAMAEVAQAPLLQILPGAAHGTDLFADHEVALTDLLLRFLNDRSG